MLTAGVTAEAKDKDSHDNFFSLTSSAAVAFVKL